MRFCFFISLCFILFSVTSCKKDFAVPENSKNTEGVYQSVEDEIDSVFEFYDNELDTIDTAPYEAESNVTLITSVIGRRAIENAGVELGCEKYKYEGRYIITKQGNWLDVTLNRDDSIRNVLSSVGDGVIYDSLIQTDLRHLKVRVRSETDTIQTKTSRIVLTSKRAWSNGVYPSIVRKVKFVGELQNSLYGTNKWMGNYWKIKNNTTTIQQSRNIDSTYIAQVGDVLKWADGHIGTVMPNPVPINYVVQATKKSPNYTVNRFSISEMNVRCKGEKTVKKIWLKSFKISETLISANKARGTPILYYR